MKKKLGVVFCLIMMFTFSLNTIVYANESSVELKTEFKSLIQKSYRYPYLGIESKISPEDNLYYIDYFNPMTGEFVKTQEVRTADDFVLREVYPDLSQKVFEYKPVSKEDYDKYCNKYGYIEKKVEPEERDSFLFTSLYKEDKVNYFFSRMFKGGLIWDVDIRTIELMDILSNGVINNAVVTAKKFTEPLTDVQQSVKELALNDNRMVLDVVILPYESEIYKYGCTFDYKGDKEHPVIVLFNNEVSIIEQMKVQLYNLNLK